MSTSVTNAGPLSKLASLSRSIDSSVSHACLSNLVVFTEDMTHEASITETMAQYVVKHPCRVILILAQPRTAESKIDVSSTQHTYNSGGSKSVTCDQITVRAKGAGVRELAGAIQPLLVPDLPINLWWRGVFLTQRLLVDQFLSFVDRFVYDGVGWTDLHYTVLQVADIIEKNNSKVGFTNFNWARLRPWRESAAELFDPGLFENEIWELNRVRVEFMSPPGAEEGNQFRALLFVAWLGVQLDWKAERGNRGQDSAQIQFSSKCGEGIDAEVVLIPQSSDGGRGLQKVIMAVDRKDNPLELTIQRDHEQHLMVTSVKKDGNLSIIRKIPHADSSDADLLYRELGRRFRNRVFDRAFKMASDVLQMV